MRIVRNRSTAEPWLSLEKRVERALRPGAPVDAPSLIQLIHEVNPSGRELSSESERRRYQMKSRLQSLLIARFKHDLEVVPVHAAEEKNDCPVPNQPPPTARLAQRLPSKSEVVSLRYRPQNRDACHALVADLDEGARAWVRLALDLREEALPMPAPAAARSRPKRKASPRPPDGAATPEALLRAGHSAMALYDLEAARESFELAFELSGGSLDSARAYLALLVDQLAAYPEAIELEPSLNPEVLDDPEVSCLLALAHARMANAPDASRLLRGRSGDRVGEGWVILGRNALSENRISEAEQWASEAQRAAPARADVLALFEELRQVKARDARPLEEEVQRIRASGDELRAEQCARQLLKLVPENPVARKVLREIDERRRSEAIRGLCARAEEALNRGEFGSAVELWRKAQELGASGLDARIAQADRQERDRRRQADTKQVLAAFDGGPSEAALLEYWAADEPVRTTIRDRLALEQLHWLEELRPSDEKRSRAAAAALMAFRPALSLGEERQHEALARLAEHEPVLRDLKVARQWIARVRIADDQRRSAEAEQLLAHAAQALANEDTEEVLRHLAPAAVQKFPDRFRARAGALVKQAGATAELKREMQQIDELLASGRPFEALAHCRIMKARQPDEVRWADRVQEVRRQLRERFRVRVTRGSFALGPELFTGTALREETGCWLDASGEKLYLISAHDSETFVAVYQMGTQTVSELVSLHTPEAFYTFAAHVEEDLLRLASGAGATLELTLSNWDVEGWTPCREEIPEGELYEGARLAPRTPFLWVNSVTPEDLTGHLRVIDLARDRQPRSVGQFNLCCLVPGRRGVSMFATNTRDSVVSELNGARNARLPVGASYLALSPDGAAWLATFGNPEEEDSELSIALILVDGAKEKTVIEGSSHLSPHVVATSLQARRTFILFSNSHRQWLMAFERRGDILSATYRLEVPAGSALLQDLSSSRVVLLYRGNRGLRIEVLGQDPPKLQWNPTCPSQPLIAFDPYHCGQSPDSADPQLEELAKGLYALSDEGRAQMVASFKERHAEDESLLVRSSEKIEGKGPKLISLSEELARFASAKHPGKPLSALRCATFEARRKRWAEVLKQLEQVDGQLLDAPRLRHLHHLRGIALLHVGNPEAALAELSVGQKLMGDCDLERWTELAAALADRSPPPDQPQGDNIKELIERLTLADHYLDAKDPAAAWAALDTSVVWSAAEHSRQVLARLAKAALLDVTADESARFRARLILARYVVPLDDGRSIPFAHLLWTPERLKEIQIDAVARLNN